MKPFESQYTEWVDGKLTGTELAEFEAQLARRGTAQQDAEHDRDDAQRLGNLLRQHLSPSTAPALTHPDFFNHQILQQIEAERRPRRVPAQPEPLWRLAWAGITCTGIAAAALLLLVIPGKRSAAPQADYYAQFLNAQAGQPGISAVTFHSQKADVAVLWLDGLEYLPKEPRP